MTEKRKSSSPPPRSDPHKEAKPAGVRKQKKKKMAKA